MNIPKKSNITVFFDSKVFENYFFMTGLKVFSMLIGILIYPFLINKLGLESYGIYIFAQTIIGFFINFISFGFHLPNIKKIVSNKENEKEKSNIVSSVFTAKSYLTVISTIIFIVVLFNVNKLYSNRNIYIICYTQILAELFFPTWYFQAVQKMKWVTYIQLFFRLLTIPFILFFIKLPEDNWIYALIISLSVILGSLVAWSILWKKEKIMLKFVSINSLKKYFKEAIPFFGSNFVGIIKEQSAAVIIGSFLGMSQVSLYDLANKIIIIPRMLTVNINGALYPKIIQENNLNSIKKIIKYEIWIGILSMLFIILFGYWIVLFLGGETMLLSYPLAIILSSTILSWLVIGSYINFIFIPNGKSYFVVKNQLVALSSFLVCCSMLFLYLSSLTVAIALAISGICEIFYCNHLIKKHKLL